MHGHVYLFIVCSIIIDVCMHALDNDGKMMVFTVCMNAYMYASVFFPSHELNV
jgi:hypothetical protein